MNTPDSRISDVRYKLYWKDQRAFDDVCFTIFYCPVCKQEKIDTTLLPINDRNSHSESDIRHTRRRVLQSIFEADFSFLHDEFQCECQTDVFYALQRIVYCYNESQIDYHNYIDYPFNIIRPFKISLQKKVEERLCLFFDTETTGLPKDFHASYKQTDNWPRVVQLAWIITDLYGENIKTQNYIIKPDGFRISADTVQIHGISHQKSLSVGVDIGVVLDEFSKDIMSAHYLVAHNLDFDINVIAAELYRKKIDSSIFEKQHICTMKQSTDFCKIRGKNGYKFPKLTELYEKLFRRSLDDEELHDASKDVEATQECFHELFINGIIKL